MALLVHIGKNFSENGRNCCGERECKKNMRPLLLTIHGTAQVGVPRDQFQFPDFFGGGQYKRAILFMYNNLTQLETINTVLYFHPHVEATVAKNLATASIMPKSASTNKKARETEKTPDAIIG